MKTPLIAGLTFVALTSAAVAGPLAPTPSAPMVLTPAQMDTVSAAAIGDINIGGLNINVTTQVAVAPAVALAVCAVCSSPTIAAYAAAYGLNFNTSDQN